MKEFSDIIALAKENIKINPYAAGTDSLEICKKYLRGLSDEVLEVEAEVKENNQVYLTDELSDIAWDYAVLLSLAEQRGLIESVDAVLAHGHQKYTERSTAFTEPDSGIWNEIKAKQKVALKAKHQERYG